MTRKQQIILGGLFLAVAIVSPGRVRGADVELERLKAAANEAIATLAVRQSVGKQAGREYQHSEFVFDTGVAMYLLRYRSFQGTEAVQNPKRLNDWGSSYGMIEPHPNWYHNGFLSATFAGRVSVCTDGLQGRVRPLVTGGPRVGYDLVFAGETGMIVVRTVALTGREELFVSVSGNPHLPRNAFPHGSVPNCSAVPKTGDSIGPTSTERPP